MLRRSYRINYDQWQQVSSERQKIGPFIIEHHPGSDDSAERDEKMLIRIDPGLVFGSGVHGSSKGCLSAIGRLYNRFSIENVVDMGTGTGILAISCAILGASRVLAIDRNPLAAWAARRNILLNGVEDRVKVVVAGDLCVLKEPSDLLIMNLEWPSLQQLLPRSEWLDYRWIVLSGFLERQWDKMKIHIPPAFRIHHREMIDDWHTVVLSRLDPECSGQATHHLKVKM
jgi:ribosomal protein L11 methyltransferase